MLRRWSLAGNLTEQAKQHVGRTVQQILVLEDELLVSVSNRVIVIDRFLETVRHYDADFPIRSIALMNKDTLLVCGNGTIMDITLNQGVMRRYMVSSSNERYSFIGQLTGRLICVGTDGGLVIAIDYNTGGEVGKIDVGFPIRGVIPIGRRLLAYGGHGKSRSRSYAFLTWDQLSAPKNGMK